LHQVDDLFELNVKLRCQKLKDRLTELCVFLLCHRKDLVFFYVKEAEVSNFV